jgi:hypothetical protein
MPHSNNGQSYRTRGRADDNEIQRGSKQIGIGKVHTSSEGNFPQDRRQRGEQLAEETERLALRLHQGPRLQVPED